MSTIEPSFESGEIEDRPADDSTLEDADSVEEAVPFDPNDERLAVDDADDEEVVPDEDRSVSLDDDLADFDTVTDDEANGADAEYADPMENGGSDGDSGAAGSGRS